MCLPATPSPIVSIEVSVILQATCLLLLKPESNPLRVQEACTELFDAEHHVVKQLCKP